MFGMFWGAAAAAGGIDLLFRFCRRVFRLFTFLHPSSGEERLLWVTRQLSDQTEEENNDKQRLRETTRRSQDHNTTLGKYSIKLPVVIQDILYYCDRRRCYIIFIKHDYMFCYCRSSLSVKSNQIRMFFLFFFKQRQIWLPIGPHTPSTFTATPRPHLTV